MSYAASEEVEFVLRTLPSGQYCTFRTRHSTAQLFGWDEVYVDKKVQFTLEHGDRGPAYIARAGSRKSRSFQRTIKFIRQLPEGSPSKTASHTFRLGSRVTAFDIAELAHFIKVDWHWLEGPDRRRQERAWWEAKYRRGPHGLSSAA